MQAKRPLGRIEVIEETVDVRDPDEGRADLFDIAKRGLRCRR